MSIISERIKQVADFKKLSLRALEIKIGASNGLIANSIKNRTDIQSKWVSKIIEIFPDVDSRWLILGTGEMISDNNIVSEPVAIYNNKDYKDPPEKCSNCVHLEEKIKEQAHELEMYKAWIKDKEDLIKMLKAEAAHRDNSKRRTA